MRKLLLGGAAIAALTLAAENPAHAIPPTPAPYSWTGCYIGGNVGGGWAFTHFGPPTREAGFQDIAGGGQVGCDVQMGMFVVGAQGMFDFSAMHGHTPIFGGKSFDTRKPWFATATGSVGYLLQPNFLVSVHGGAAWVRDEHKFLEGGTFVDNVANVTRTGTVLGVSAEWLCAHGWSMFARYDYMQFGTKDVNFRTVSGFPNFSEDVRQHVQSFMVGFNFRFNSAPPPPP